MKESTRTSLKGMAGTSLLLALVASGTRKLFAASAPRLGTALNPISRSTHGNDDGKSY